MGLTRLPSKVQGDAHVIVLCCDVLCAGQGILAKNKVIILDW